MGMYPHQNWYSFVYTQPGELPMTKLPPEQKQAMKTQLLIVISCFVCLLK